MWSRRDGYAKFGHLVERILGEEDITHAKGFNIGSGSCFEETDSHGSETSSRNLQAHWRPPDLDAHQS
jgi:hypothetical protein